MGPRSGQLEEHPRRPPHETDVDEQYGQPVLGATWVKGFAQVPNGGSQGFEPAAF